MRDKKHQKMKLLIGSVKKKGLRFSIWMALASLAGKMTLVCLKKGFHSLF